MKTLYRFFKTVNFLCFQLQLMLQIIYFFVLLPYLSVSIDLLESLCAAIVHVAFFEICCLSLEAAFEMTLEGVQSVCLFV